LEQICKVHGENRFSQLNRAIVTRLVDEKASTPGAARNRLKALKALFRWAVDRGEAVSDPTIGVRPIRLRSQGHHCWTEEEISRFEAHFPVGSKPRLAMTLMLYTACRRGDVVRLGPQHVSEGRLRYQQAKNAKRNPTDVNIPVHPQLANIIEKTKSGHLSYLVTEFGKPFSVAGFGNRFRDWCNEAALPNCSAHGLRKAAATRLADAGASALEIMAVTGHKSLAEVERYTRAANRSALADAAMSKIK
jgi:integrase